MITFITQALYILPLTIYMAAVGWQGWKVESLYFTQLVSLSIGAVLAGYTVKDILPSVQDTLLKPPVQFCVYFTLAASLVGLKAIQTLEGIKNATIAAVVTTVIVQIASVYLTKQDDKPKIA